MKKTLFVRIITILIIPVMLITGIRINSPQKAEAATAAELRALSAQLQAEIKANQEHVKDLGHEVATLKDRLAQINADIQATTRQIELTGVKISELEIKLAETEAELERQKGILKASIRALYKKSGVSSVELLVGSDSFSEFINDQEYLERLKAGIQASTERIIVLKKQIETEKKQQEDLKIQQEVQRTVIVAKQQEQQTILAETQGEEARYASMVSKQKKELQDAESALTKLLAERQFRSQGPVTRGDRIGSLGSTGYSTGPHLHFMVKNDGHTVNPSAGGSNIINGYAWPVIGDTYISTPYGNVHCSNYTGCAGGGSYGIFHSGLDIAGAYGSPVIAVDDGQIVYRGCQGALGFVVVVEHGGGWQTWYPHMTSPGGQASGYC